MERVLELELERVLELMVVLGGATTLGASLKLKVSSLRL